jgi:hypothetical protein
MHQKGREAIPALFFALSPCVSDAADVDEARLRDKRTPPAARR